MRAAAAVVHLMQVVREEQAAAEQDTLATAWEETQPLIQEAAAARDMERPIRAATEARVS